MDKVVASPSEAVADIADGSSIAVGGFGTAGVPWALVDALHRQGARHLRVVSNNCGFNGLGLAVLLRDNRIDRVTASYIGTNEERCV